MCATLTISLVYFIAQLSRKKKEKKNVRTKKKFNEFDKEAFKSIKDFLICLWYVCVSFVSRIRNFLMELHFEALGIRSVKCYYMTSQRDKYTRDKK